MGSRGKKIISNSAILVSSLLIDKAFRFALMVFAARSLGDANYGIFSFALAFTTLFLILSDLGVHQLLIRELARKPENFKDYVGNTLFIKLILAITTSLLIVIIVNLTNKPHDVIVAVYLMGSFQILFSFLEYFKAIFQAYQMMIYDAIITIVLAILTVSFGAAILFFKHNFIMLAAAYVMAAFIALIFCIILFYKKFPKIKLNYNREVTKFFIKEGLPFGFLYFFSMFYIYIATVLLSFLESDQAVGWYNAANRLILIMLFIPKATMKAIFPILSKNYETSFQTFKRIFSKVFKSMFIIGISVAFLFYLLSDKIVLLLYGQQYINSAGILKVMAWSSALVFLTTTMSHATRSANHQRFTAKVITIGAVINVISNLLMIPAFGYMGAAYSYLITQVFIFISLYIYISKTMFIPPVLKLAPKIIGVNLVMVVYVLYFIKLSLFVLVPTALVINIAMVFLFKYFDADELSLLKDIVKPSGTRS